MSRARVVSRDHPPLYQLLLPGQGLSAGRLASAALRSSTTPAAAVRVSRSPGLPAEDADGPVADPARHVDPAEPVDHLIRQSRGLGRGRQRQPPDRGRPAACAGSRAVARRDDRGDGLRGHGRLPRRRSRDGAVRAGSPPACSSAVCLGEISPVWVSEGGLEPSRRWYITETVIHHRSKLTRQGRPGWHPAGE